MKKHYYCVYFWGDSPEETEGILSEKSAQEVADESLQESVEDIEKVEIYEVPAGHEYDLTSELDQIAETFNYRAEAVRPGSRYDF